MSTRPETLSDLLIDQATRQPDRLALGFLQDGCVEDLLALTYGELHERAMAIAALLREGSGCAPGDRALLAFRPGLDFCAAFWGCLYAGVVAVPVPPPELPWERNLPPLLAVVEDAQPAVALTTSSLESTMKSLGQRGDQLRALRWIAIDTSTATSPRKDRCLPSGLGPSTAAYLQYTSGSTASSRGVVVSHGNLLANVRGIGSRFEHRSTDVAVCWLPTFHAMGLLHGIVHPTCLGFPAYLMSPRACLKHPIRWLEAISHFRATHSGAPNFGFELCVRRIRREACEGLDLRSWAVAFLSAEPIHQQTMERFGQAFSPYGFDPRAFAPGYGLSEACTRVSAARRTSPRAVTLCRSSLRRDRVVLVPSGSSDHEQVVSCGPPLPGVSVAIVDPETSVPSPASGVGEVWVRGPNVSCGYWRQPERTERTFRGFVTPDGTGPWLRTGDLGFLQDEQLYLTGRYKDIIIIRGKTYYPQELERVAEQAYPSVRPACCAAFGVTVEREERAVVVAEVERRRTGDGAPVVEAQLQNHQGDDRRSTELDPGYEPDDPAAFDAKAIEEAIRRAVAARVGLRLHRVVLIVPGSIPKTPTGKVRRRACRLAFLDDQLRLIDGPSSPAQKRG